MMSECMKKVNVNYKSFVYNEEFINFGVDQLWVISFTKMVDKIYQSAIKNIF